MIEIKNITKSFKDKKVLHGISGKFEKGKTNLIIGASGTGKSVLLKCLVGLLSPDNGKVLFDGRYFTESDKNTTTQIRREIGMLFQGSALFDSKNVEEDIKFPLDILTEISEKEKIEKVNFFNLYFGQLISCDRNFSLFFDFFIFKTSFCFLNLCFLNNWTDFSCESCNFTHFDS